MYLKLRFLTLATLLGVGIVNAQTVAPQDSPPPEAASVQPANEKLELEIKSLVKAYERAFNSADVDALTAHWSDQGVFVDQATGETIEGREAIEASFRDTFKRIPGIQLACETRSISSDSSGVVTEEGEAIVTGADDATSRSLYQVVYVKKGDRWLIDRVTDNLSDLSFYRSREGSTAPLQDLEWLLGQWVDQSDKSNVEFTCQRTRGGNFISRQYTVIEEDEIVASGIEVIGWDAHQEKIRSWIFDQNGTTVQRLWKQKDDHWRIQSTATLADGARGSSTTIMTPLSPGKYRVEKVNRIIDGQLMPNTQSSIVERL